MKRRIIELIVILTIGTLLDSWLTTVSFQSASPSKPETLVANVYRPEGPGPFPALVLLHTCGGLVPHVLQWAARLKTDGYVALVVDNFAPASRAKNVCESGSNPSVEDVAWHAFGALAYLRTLSFIDRDRIGVMGLSYGAMAALQASRESLMQKASATAGRFRVAIAFYPRCRYFNMDTALPVLLLLGAADTRTPPGDCVLMAELLQRKGLPIRWQLYARGTHSFDQADAWSPVVPPGSYHAV